MTKETKFYLIFAVFMAVVCVINVIASKIVVFAGLTFSVSAYAYALTFPCTDVVAEVWGKRKARQMVWFGFLGNVIIVAFILLAVHHVPAEFWADNDAAFGTVLGMVPRILFASMCAYLVSQLHDIWAFHFWKRVTSGRALWLRNNASTMTSQLIDTVTFVLVAFAGDLPTSVLPGMIFGQYVIKIAIAVVDTPIVYLLVKWVSGQWEVRETNQID